MSSPDWSRVKEVFQILLNHPRSDWIRVIEAECAGEPALRKEIESLVEHTTESGPYFDDLARRCGLPGSEVPAEGLVGRTIGSYRLEKLLDRGGMGSVYLASRTEGDFEVRAAVKVVATGLLSQGSRRRFLSERRILAGLQHPNVTRLFDGGITEDGTPYFVKECIDGRPIDSYCDEEELDIRERIRLFLQVCEAVEHAHRNLIVHRDLKPANILVDGRGDAKLLDFGIARALDSAQGEFQTGTRHPHPMTVASASPEQLQGLRVATGSDIYGLGLLLYRLVTGRRPYRVTGRSFAEMEEVVCRADPVPPHRVLEGDGENGVGESPAYPGLSAIAETRKTSPARLVKLLAGDLGHILMMALRKEPERRYRSVQALASDLRRYLDELTVSAQPDTRAYRVRRFAARHKRAVAVGGVMIAMVLALVGLSVQ